MCLVPLHTIDTIFCGYSTPLLTASAWGDATSSPFELFVAFFCGAHPLLKSQKQPALKSQSDEEQGPKGKTILPSKSILKKKIEGNIKNIQTKIS